MVNPLAEFNTELNAGWRTDRIGDSYNAQVLAVQLGEPGVVGHGRNDDCKISERKTRMHTNLSTCTGKQMQAHLFFMNMLQNSEGQSDKTHTPALQVTEIQQIEFTVVLRMIDSIDIL